MLEAHIMQAQAAAMAADERELQRMSEGCENYHVLGLPPGTIICCFRAVFWSKNKGGGLGPLDPSPGSDLPLPIQNL